MDWVRQKEVDAAGGAPAQDSLGQRGVVKQGLTIAGKFIVTVLILAIGYGGYSYLKSTKPEVPQRQKREKVWSVNTAKIVFANHTPELVLYGETVSGRRVELRALVSGKIIETGANLREGAQIKSGETLIVVDDFTYQGALTEAEAHLAEARARKVEIAAQVKSETDSLRRAREQLKLAKADLARATRLVRRGTISQKLVEDRQLVVSQRRQSVDNFTNTLAVQKARQAQHEATFARLQWGVERARRNVRDTVLTAPFNAYVSSVNAQVGRLVNANDRVATLLDKDWIEVRFTLSDAQFGRIVAQDGSVIGRTVKVLWHVGDKPLSYKATIRRVGAEISSKSGGINVFARIENPHQPLSMRAGAFVEIRVPDRTYEKVARLPQTALYGGDKVYVIGSDSRLEERKVQLVGNSSTDILVRGDIKAGERVITTRLSTIGTGQKVKDRTVEAERTS